MGLAPFLNGCQEFFTRYGFFGLTSYSSSLWLGASVVSVDAGSDPTKYFGCGFVPAAFFVEVIFA